MTTPVVSVIVVSYQTRELVLRCLAALRPGVPAEVIVVDNGSSDGSADAIKAAFPQVTLVRLNQNIGWGRAVNAAAGHACGDYLLLLNPDAVGVGDVVSELAGFAAAYPENKLYTGRTLRADGGDDWLSCFALPSLWGYACFALGLSSVFRHSRLFNPESLPWYDRRTVREVPAASGCLLLVERAAFETLGGFDPRYFLYSEDTDLCARAAAYGWRPLLDPDAAVIHVGGASQRRAGKRIRVLRGKCTYVRRHWLPWRRRAGLALLATGVLLRATLAPGWREVWQARRTWLPGWPPVRSPHPVDARG
ncbi:MAG: glycosyltransferase family 2 protein [Micromonosporaceae bacterium]